MRKVMRPRFYCEFCNKGSGSGGHMRKHETRCTLNPLRECGMCAHLGLEQPDLQSLIAMLPNPEPFKREVTDFVWTHWAGLEEAVDAVMPKLRAVTVCPACILAAIRLRGIPAPEITSFKFKDEMKALLDAENARAYEEEIERERHQL